MAKYRSPRDFGNVKMNGKITMKNPCPCCDTIENKKKYYENKQNRQKLTEKDLTQA